MDFNLFQTQPDQQFAVNSCYPQTVQTAPITASQSQSVPMVDATDMGQANPGLNLVETEKLNQLLDTGQGQLTIEGLKMLAEAAVLPQESHQFIQV